MGEARQTACELNLSAVEAVLCRNEEERGRFESRMPAPRTLALRWPEPPPPALVRRLLRRLAPATPPAIRGRRLRVLFAGPSFQFIALVAEQLSKLEQCDVRFARWRGIGSHHPEESLAANDWADVVICEWAGANAVWHSRNKPSGQRLIVRLHRFEMDKPWPHRVDWSAVDQLVAVSPHFRARMRTEFSAVDRMRVVAIPNYVDALEFDRPKPMDARFQVGLLGMVPMRKRLDLALDIIAEVRQRDARFRLFVKGEMPWNRPAWTRRAERAYFRKALRRVRREKALRDAVVFEPHGPDVARWLRGIGALLSTSDAEGSHVAVAEAMMSRATGVLMPWPGSRAVYGEPWVQPDSRHVVDRILEQAEPVLWERRRQQARRGADRYEFERVFEAWAALLVADRDPDAFYD